MSFIRSQSLPTVRVATLSPDVVEGWRYNLEMANTPLQDLGWYDAVIIVIDHSSYDYQSIVDQSQLIIDRRNATKDIQSPKIVRC